MDDVKRKYDTKNPFSVPDGYFDSLGDRVMERIGEEEKLKPPRRLAWRHYAGWVALLAGAIVLVQWLLPYVVQQGQSPVEQIAYEPKLDKDFNPTREEIIEYLAQETDFSELLLSEK